MHPSPITPWTSRRKPRENVFIRTCAKCMSLIVKHIKLCGDPHLVEAPADTKECKKVLEDLEKCFMERWDYRAFADLSKCRVLSLNENECVEEQQKYNASREEFYSTLFTPDMVAWNKKLVALEKDKCRSETTALMKCKSETEDCAIEEYHYNNCLMRELEPTASRPYFDCINSPNPQWSQCTKLKLELHKKLDEHAYPAVKSIDPIVPKNNSYELYKSHIRPVVRTWLAKPYFEAKCK